MFEKNKLISIGKLAEITGVNKKSLLYYEKLGILMPDYINPSSNYRYFSLSKVNQVVIIKAWIDFGIPLTEFKELTERENFTYMNFLDYGQQVAEQRIRTLQDSLQHIVQAKNVVSRIEEQRISKQPEVHFFKEKYFYVMPFTPTMEEKMIYELFGNLFKQIAEKKLNFLFEWGFLTEHLAETIQNYCFVEVEGIADDEHIKVIPESEYLCLLDTNQASLLESYPELFNPNQITYVIENKVYNDFIYKDSDVVETRISINK